MTAPRAGMLITMSDMGVGGPLAGPGYGMDVYGPRGLSVLTAALGTFVNTRQIGLQVPHDGMLRRLPCLRSCRHSWLWLAFTQLRRSNGHTRVLHCSCCCMMHVKPMLAPAHG